MRALSTTIGIYFCALSVGHLSVKTLDRLQLAWVARHEHHVQAAGISCSALLRIRIEARYLFELNPLVTIPAGKFLCDHNVLLPFVIGRQSAQVAKPHIEVAASNGGGARLQPLQPG